MCDFNAMISKDYDLTGLADRYGEKNVENAAIFIMNQLTPDKRQLRVNIPATASKVGAILKATHAEHMGNYCKTCDKFDYHSGDCPNINEVRAAREGYVRCDFRLPDGAAANPKCPDCGKMMHIHSNRGEK